MSVPKWTEDRTEALVAFVGDETPVSQATVVEAAETLETSPRAVGSKLRKMGYDVEKADARANRAFDEEQTALLRTFVEDNAGEYTYAEIAKVFADGAFSPKSIQGKILSMELTGSVKPAPKPEVQRTFSEAEEATFIEMVEAGAFIEDIAEALDRQPNQIRGKALSLLRSGDIAGIPRQKHTKGATRKDPLDGMDVAEMTVEEIAAAIEKTPRGVRTMLTRRGLDCADHNGAERKAKAEAAAA